MLIHCNLIITCFFISTNSLIHCGPCKVSVAMATLYNTEKCSKMCTNWKMSNIILPDPSYLCEAGLRPFCHLDKIMKCCPSTIRSFLKIWHPFSTLWEVDALGSCLCRICQNWHWFLLNRNFHFGELRPTVAYSGRQMGQNQFWS